MLRNASLLLCFWRASGGNISVIFILCSVALLGAGGLALDYTYWNAQKIALQEAADAGALSGAVELGRGGNQAEQRAEDLAEKLAAENKEGITSASTAVAVADEVAETVNVTASITGTRFLSGLLMNGDPNIEASATATIVDKSVACIYALNPTAAQALNGNGNAILEGTNCAIQVNSTDANALSNSGTITASDICVAGGYSGSGYTPTPQDNCPAASDPFADLVIPAPGACTDTNLSINSITNLGGGVYCGGIHISGGGDVTMAPGTYFFVDGPLKVTGGGSVVGDGVVFVLVGTASMDIAGQGEVRTTPPTSGALEGYSVIQDRAAPLGGTSKITGEGTFDFPGIIYLPRQALDIAGRAVGNLYTPTYAAVVADTIKISGQGELSVTADTSIFSKKSASELTVVNVRLID